MKRFEALICYLPHCNKKATRYVTYSERYVCGFCSNSIHNEDNVITLVDPRECEHALELVNLSIKSVESTIGYDKTLSHKWNYQLETLVKLRKRVNQCEEDLQELIRGKNWPKLSEAKVKIDSLKQEWENSEILMEMLKYLHKEDIRLHSIGVVNGRIALSENAALKKTCRDLRNGKIKIETNFNKKIDELKAKVGDFRTQNGELRAQNDELRTQNDELRAQNDELRSHNGELITQNNELRSQNEELRTQNNELRTQNNELKAQNKEFKTQDNELRIQNNELITQNTSIIIEKSGLTRELEVAKENLKELEHQSAQIDCLKDDNTKLEKELAKSQSKNKAQASQIEDLRSNFQDMKEVATNSQTSMEQLKTSHSQTEDKIEHSFKHLQNTCLNLQQALSESIENVWMDIEFFKVIQNQNQKENKNLLKSLKESQITNEDFLKSIDEIQKTQSMTKEVISQSQTSFTTLNKLARKNGINLTKEEVEFLDKLPTRKSIKFDMSNKTHKAVLALVDKQMLSHLDQLELMNINKTSEADNIHFLSTCIPPKLRTLFILFDPSSKPITPYLPHILKLKSNITSKLALIYVTMKKSEKQQIEQAFSHIKLVFGYVTVVDG
ncbi:unnamed protein product [Moneuplotes crassus]|uniref:Uncharacterized protein n=1 Tax=Euplotes crassus TaxID=5936 RepID=A0AAD2D984_EUPCR|nr:unnamed protein product [Moneuplotes crassus]